MTTKEKAIELVAKYYQEFIKDYKVLACFSDEIRNSIYNKRETFAKKCALIAVDECIKHEKQIVEQIKSLQLRNSFIVIINDGSFWRQVKHEIETFKQQEQ